MYAYQVKRKLQDLFDELSMEASYFTYNGYYKYKSELSIRAEIDAILEQLFSDEYLEVNIILQV